MRSPAVPRPLPPRRHPKSRDRSPEAPALPVPPEHWDSSTHCIFAPRLSLNLLRRFSFVGWVHPLGSLRRQQMMNFKLAVGVLALGLVAGVPASAHMSRSHAATMKRCHAMSHKAMMRNRQCASMMKMHHSSMASHSMMKSGAMKDGMMSKDSMHDGKMSKGTMPNHQ